MKQNENSRENEKQCTKQGDPDDSLKAKNNQ